MRALMTFIKSMLSTRSTICSSVIGLGFSARSEYAWTGSGHPAQKSSTARSSSSCVSDCPLGFEIRFIALNKRALLNNLPLNALSHEIEATTL